MPSASVSTVYTEMFCEGGPSTKRERIAHMIELGYSHAQARTSLGHDAYHAFQWCMNEIGPGRFTSEGRDFLFRSEEEATMFALVWS